MTLDDLILHPRSRMLAEKLSVNLPQGLVIDGPSGTGVAVVAKAFAHSVGSPELIILPKKKAKNEFVVDMKEGNVIIDDIRELYERTRTKQPGSYVYILDTGERSMTTAAQNAFLKLLEEPRSGVHFIIATHQFDQLLPTIVSRTQRLSLLPITSEQTASLITDLRITDTVKQARLAFVGQGRPGLIKALASDESLYEARAAIMTDAKTLLSGDMYEKVKVINKYKDTRADALTLLDDMNYQIKTILSKNPEQKLALAIERYLKARERIAGGGNIRLQLLAEI